jgi:hypothetical protein
LIDEADDRLLRLVFALVQAGMSEFSHSEIQNELLDQRLAAHRLNPNEGSTWVEVKARVKQNL